VEVSTRWYDRFTDGLALERSRAIEGGVDYFGGTDVECVAHTCDGEAVDVVTERHLGGEAVVEARLDSQEASLGGRRDVNDPQARQRGGQRRREGSRCCDGLDAAARYDARDGVLGVLEVSAYLGVDSGV
jgi:hypothetical protein